jgi:hypothetical protein
VSCLHFYGAWYLYRVWLPTRGTYTRTILEQRIAGNHQQVNCTLTTDHLEIIKMMVHIGLGWSLLQIVYEITLLLERRSLCAACDARLILELSAPSNGLYILSRRLKLRTLTQSFSESCG